jgi:predicted lipoprotein
MKKFIGYTLVCCLILITACGDDDNADAITPSDNFDRASLLVNWADNIIIPSYTALGASLVTLESVAQTFISNPTNQNLDAIRASWFDAYKAFQKVSMFEIGKAEAINYRNRLNVYPCNTDEIEGLVVSGSWDFNLPSTIDAQGFPAIDYMIFGLGSDQEIIDFFSIHENAQYYKQYLLDLVNTMQTLTSDVLADWENGYRQTYVANTSSSATGAVDQTVNAFLFYYEKALRAGKVGIPAGVFNGTPLPQNVESLYKEDISKVLLQEALTTVKNFFNGSGTGAGLQTYLDELNVKKNGTKLSTLINNQFDAAAAEIETLNPNFVIQITTDNIKMLEAYDQLQRNVVLLKVDMLQALNIDIDYVDADGD